MPDPTEEQPVEEQAEQIARAFHAAYEELAPEHGYETREASRRLWAEVPDNNRALMIGTVKRLMATGVIHPAVHEAPEEWEPRHVTAIRYGEICGTFDTPNARVVCSCGWCTGWDNGWNVITKLRARWHQRKHRRAGQGGGFLP